MRRLAQIEKRPRSLAPKGNPEPRAEAQATPSMNGTELIQGLKDRKLYGKFFDYEGYQLLRQSDSAHGIAKALRSAGIPTLADDTEAEDIIDLLIRRSEVQQAIGRPGLVGILMALASLVNRLRTGKAKATDNRRIPVLRLRTPGAVPRPASGHQLIELLKQRGFYGQLLDYKGYQDLRAATTTDAVEKAVGVEAGAELHTVDEVLEALTHWHSLQTGESAVDTGVEIFDVLLELLNYGQS